MPGCPYFIAYTFAHLLGAVAVTGISTENPLFGGLDKKPMTSIVLFLITLALLFVIGSVEVGPLKYVLFAALCILLGQILSGLVKRLKAKDLLSNTLIIIGTIFGCMAAVGFIDRGNMLSWGPYLVVAFFGLIIAMIVTAFTTKTKAEADNTQLWISRALLVLFTLFVGYHVAVLKVHAKLCSSKPDYINESTGLYLDLINLFSVAGRLQEQ